MLGPDFTVHKCGTSKKFSNQIGVSGKNQSTSGSRVNYLMRKAVALPFMRRASAHSLRSILPWNHWKMTESATHGSFWPA